MKKIEHEFYDFNISQAFIFGGFIPEAQKAELRFNKEILSLTFSMTDIEALANAMGDNKAERIQLALDLAVNYDGMTEPDSLRSLIDDMVKALKGEMEIIDIAAHRQEGKEDGSK